MSVDKRALARFLFIIQNSEEAVSGQWTVVSCRIRAVTYPRASLSAAVLTVRATLAELLTDLLDRRRPLRYRGARCKEVGGDCSSPPRDRTYRQ